jgi:glycine cleavage system pyridoxal-binding protein P
MLLLSLALIFMYACRIAALLQVPSADAVLSAGLALASSSMLLLSLALIFMYACRIAALLQVPSADAVLSAGLAAGLNLRKVDGSHVGISLDETTRLEDVDTLLKVK